MNIKRFISIISFVVLFFFLQDPTTHVLGFPSVDLLDTITLRGLFVQQITGAEPALFWPIGYDWSLLLPNRLDHLSFLPFSVLPFPLADNLWWFMILTCQAITSHRLGRYVGKTELSGWSTMVFWLFSESILREANLHHAPQSSLFLLPLLLEFCLRLQSESDKKTQHAILLSVIVSITTLTYYYSFLFVFILMSILLYKQPKLLFGISGISICICLPEILYWLSKNPPIIEKTKEVLFTFHWYYFLSKFPMDKSVGLSLVTFYAIITRHNKYQFKNQFLIASLLFLILIPIWEPLSQIHPFFERFHWPERISIFVTLCILPIIASLRYNHYLIPIIILESFLFSANYPLQWTSVKHELCLRELGPNAGRVLAFPLIYKDTNLTGLHHRIHGLPMVNPMVLPMGSPKKWNSWMSQHSIIGSLEIVEHPISNQEIQFQKIGIDAIYLMDGGLSPLVPKEELIRLQAILGPSIDIGCAHVWWYSQTSLPPRSIDGDMYRQANSIEDLSLPLFMKPIFLEEP